MQRTRAFIAIPLQKETQRQISKLQQRLGKALPELKSVPTENLHLTLHFLGEQHHDQLAKIASSMLSIGQKQKVFNVTLAGLGFFPHRRRPKILWLAAQPETELLNLYSQLAEKLKVLGIEPDPRRYHPHLTIGRCKHSPEHLDSLRPFLSHSCGSLTIDRMILFSSRLTAERAVHTPLQTVMLSTAID